MLKAARCPGCGGDVEIPTDREVAYCIYCGTSIIVREAGLTSGPSIDNLLSLAGAAREAANPTEAYDYYKRVLEQDPRSWRAWLGKAASAGWSSTLTKFNFIELMADARKAIDFAPESEREAVKAEIAKTATQVARACFSIANKFKSQHIRVDSTWPEYLMRCGRLLDLLEFSFGVHPTVEAARDIVTLCNDNLAPLSYVDFHGRRQARTVTTSYRTALEVRRGTYLTKLREIEPDAVPVQSTAPGLSPGVVALVLVLFVVVAVVIIVILLQAP